MPFHGMVAAVVRQVVPVIGHDDDQRAIVPRLLLARVDEGRDVAIGVVYAVAVALRIRGAGEAFAHRCIEGLVAGAGHHRVEERFLFVVRAAQVEGEEFFIEGTPLGATHDGEGVLIVDHIEADGLQVVLRSVLRDLLEWPNHWKMVDQDKGDID